MPYVCGLDCNLVRNDSQISEKNPVSGTFMGLKKLTTEKNHICWTFWADAVVLENLILFLGSNLLTFLQTKLFLKRGFSKRKEFAPFRVGHFSIGGQKHF